MRAHGRNPTLDYLGRTSLGGINLDWKAFNKSWRGNSIAGDDKGEESHGGGESHLGSDGGEDNEDNE